MPHPNKLPLKFKKLKRRLYDKQRRENNLEREKKRMKDYYEKEKVKILEHQHNYYLEHKAEKKAYNKKYHKSKKFNLI